MRGSRVRQGVLYTLVMGLAWPGSVRAQSEDGPRPHWGFIDREGTIVISSQFDKAWPFSDGLALVKLGTRYFSIDHAGSVRIVVDAGSVPKPVSNGPALVWKNSYFGIIDANGR